MKKPLLPSKPRNAERRSREHLTPREAHRLIAAAKQCGCHGHRDSTMILLAYRHGFRVSELLALRRDQLDLEQGIPLVELRQGLAMIVWR
jgi:site-specific recombinase XerD